MDFALTDDQRAVLDGVDAILEGFAGPARAAELAAKGGYDDALESALAEAGFGEIALGAETGALEAALVTERVAHAAGGVAFAASGLVAPLVVGKALAGPVSLVEAADGGPVRFAPAARTLLVLDGDVARCARLEVGDVEP
ncbi:MAG: acyl-CoA dehydrogenase, partial [Myxococcota bacterium]